MAYSIFSLSIHRFASPVSGRSICSPRSLRLEPQRSTSWGKKLERTIRPMEFNVPLALIYESGPTPPFMSCSCSLNNRTLSYSLRYTFGKPRSSKLSDLNLAVQRLSPGTSGRYTKFRCIATPDNLRIPVSTYILCRGLLVTVRRVTCSHVKRACYVGKFSDIRESRGGSRIHGKGGRR